MYTYDSETTSQKLGNHDSETKCQKLLIQDSETRNAQFRNNVTTSQKLDNSQTCHDSKSFLTPPPPPEDM